MTHHKVFSTTVGFIDCLLCDCSASSYLNSAFLERSDLAWINKALLSSSSLAWVDAGL